MKLGRLSKEEQQYIRDNVHHLTYIEIAENLDREPVSIKKHIEKKIGLETTLKESSGPVTKSEYEFQLEREAFFPALCEQFDERDIEHFKYQWNQFYEQFGGDVLPTEKLQIVDAIRLDLLMNSNLRNTAMTKKSIMDMEAERSDLKKRIEDGTATPEERTELFNIDRHILSLRAGEQASLKQYQDLQDRKDKIFRSLKALRQQRIERIESSKENFSTWMGEIISNPQKRRELGTHMEKMRLAVLDEEIRLAAYHKYEDGIIDQPLLNCDTVKPDNGKQSIFEEEKDEE